MVIEMINCGFLNETLIWSFIHWWQFDTFSQALIDKIVGDPGFNAFIATYFRQRMINAVEKELSQNPLSTKRFRHYPINPHQLPMAPFWTRRTNPGARVVEDIIGRIKDTVTARRSRAKSAKTIDAHRHRSLRQTVAYWHWPLRHSVWAHALALEERIQTSASAVLPALKRRWRRSTQFFNGLKEHSTIARTAWRTLWQSTSEQCTRTLPDSRSAWPCRWNCILSSPFTPSWSVAFHNISSQSATLKVHTKPRPYGYSISALVRPLLLW